MERKEEKMMTMRKMIKVKRKFYKKKGSVKNALIQKMNQKKLMRKLKII